MTVRIDPQSQTGICTSHRMCYVMVNSRLKVQKLRDQSEASVRSGYGLGTDWVRSYMAWDIMGVYA